MISRRQALKNIGFTVGHIALTPTVTSFLYSCSQEVTLEWTPQLLSEDEAKILEALVDRIIPETDTPGAKSLGIPQFIDTYIHQVPPEEDVSIFKKAAGRLTQKLGIGKEKKVADITEEEYTSVLITNLQADMPTIKTYTEALESVTTPEDFDSLSEEATIYSYMAAVRGLAIFGFKNTQQIGEDVLAYLPVPGEQIGCAPLETLTRGKAWSL